MAYEGPSVEQAVEDAVSRANVTVTETNKDGIVGGTITPGTSGATFGSQSVPNGFGVVVQNDPSNSDTVQIQDDSGNDRHALEPGGEFTVYVSNLDQISVTGTGNNPTVHATVEAP